MKYPKNAPEMIRQQDMTDCGVACLLSIIRYYGGTNTIEQLRQLSGTSANGTTLLGLCQAAEKTGFHAAGCISDIDTLISYPSPVILHLEAEDQLQHYVVCFGTIRKKDDVHFAIGDPAVGLIHLSLPQLDALWRSKICLTVEPAANFKEFNNFKHTRLVWFKKLIAPDVPSLFMVCLLGVIIAVFGLIMAVFSRKLIDDILPSKDISGLYAGVGWVMVLLLMKEIIGIIRQHMLIRQAKDFSIRLMSFFFQRLLRLPTSFFDTRKTGEITARLIDSGRIQRVITQLFSNVVIDLLAAIGSLSCIFIFSFRTGLFSLLALPFLFLLIYLNRRHIIDMQRNTMNGYAMTESDFISVLQNIRTVKGYGKQQLFTDRNKQIYQHYQHTIVLFGKMQIRLSFLINSFCILLLGSILLLGGYDVIKSRQTPGELMAIISLLSTLLPCIVNLALVIIPFREAAIAFDRVFELASIQPEPAGGALHIDNFTSLQVRKLSFHFPGGDQLLKNIWLDINKGEMIAILGENGSGKTTLLQILQKNYYPDGGDILINGTIPLSNAPLAQWRQMIGVVPQHIRLFNGTVLENIAFEDAFLRPGEVIQFLDEYGISAFFKVLPQSYKTVVGEGGMTLPGGLQQLIALARAIYHRPRLLILDEATAGMDRATERFVLSLLSKLKSEMGILFVTHRLYILKNFCDKMYILENGVITAYGDHERLLNSENFYSLYWKDIVS